LPELLCAATAGALAGTGWFADWLGRACANIAATSTTQPVTESLSVQERKEDRKTSPHNKSRH